MLSFTDDVNLKLVPDTEKYQFIETTIGAGVSMICKGYAEALKILVNILHITILVNLLHISNT